MSRRRTRELALQVMFEVDVGRQDLAGALERARAQLSESEWAYLRQLCEGTWAARREIDRQLQPLTRDWPLDRLANTDRTLLRLAAYELLHTETPPQIVINEAVALAKRYGTDDSGRFVNGVLGTLLRQRAGGPRSEMSPETVRAHLWVTGTVQGVGFRFFAVRAAKRYAVSGFVRNLPDGRVEAAAEGMREAVSSFIQELQRGPSGAVVRTVDVQWETPEGRQGFVIR